ncbi:N-acetylmuramoyl-L-alanine amidase [Marvinbryantia formatexigens DSM 14469]|uniref:N-acetylmuramoyl-L-alanine amidase n=1 Tax=Marvinbryantia formatexigens DSM 14469 TaxID=478749 RepID=C6LH11_9FIRM|nr:N-acetylmuramoyl-L-alanine amidase [Marvinbryantia formatexigens]EET60070.1 N-acetylmuramoyl-L-alanine amidase [Marvinbryantia formatexigens DSM 14469]UWO23862.1 N-acetylmuramoyl-L-alanine amidase [Marvinbryantia formatexigens DSM 14469]SDG50948.1 N-acetylmuramoyl-L-alanine amidase [Marvinbryantia formatexigens]
MKKIVKKSLGMLVLLFAFLMLPTGQAKAENVVVVLDPGHGGAEAGARSTWDGVNYYEEVLNLKIAMYAKEELETYSGVTVYMTRTTNTGVSMDREARVKFAKSRNADALVSIHLNSGGKGKVSGALAMVPSLSGYPYQEASEAQALAKVILAQLHSSTGVTNRGFQYDDELGIILYGMKKQNETIKTSLGKLKGVGTYRLPSMIIEHCFLDCKSDCIKYLSSEAKLKKLGVADATGIAKYYGLKKGGGTQEPQPEPVVKNGWQTENGKKCYYINDVKVKSKWKSIGGKYYYFDASGYLKTGPFKIGKKMYITDENGVRQTGLVEYKGRHYYASSKGTLYTGWQTINGKKYYFSPTTGRAQKGLKKIGKNTYYFHPTTGVMQTKWVKLANGKKMYFRKADGVQVKSKWLRINKKYYYIGSNGYAYVNTKKRISGKVYKFNAIGVCTNRK